MLLDWRAPAARPFYTATGASPENMRRRRQFHTRGRRVVEFTDETFGRPDGAAQGDAALLAAVNAPRGAGMRDIVATIQAEQDEIIRLDHPGVLVIEGGPGTGKTVVALHRVAYLLYTQRQRIERHGVLVVGPNSAFLNHINRVLPSLGESSVVFTTPGDLVPGLHVTAEDTPDCAAFKGSLKILDVLAAAIADRQRMPERPLDDRTGGRHDAHRRRDRRAGRGTRHAAAGSRTTRPAPCLPTSSAWALTERAIARIGRGWLTREDRAAWEKLRAGPARRARRQRSVLRRAGPTVAGLDAARAVGCAVPLPRTAACRGCRPVAVARRRRGLDGVGRAAARRAGRPAGPRQGGSGRRAGRRAGAEVRDRVCRRGAGHDDRPRGPDGRRGSPDCPAT